MTALVDAIRRHATSGRENPAIDDGHLSLTWLDTAEAIESTIGEVKLLLPGDRPVALVMDHSAPAVILLRALREVGVPIIPLPPFFSEMQREAALDDAGAAAVVPNCVLEGRTVRFAPEVRNPPPAKLPEGTAVISFSSGSTGDPKGVCLSTSHLVAVATAVCDYLGRDTAGRHLPVLPFGILLEQVAGLFASLIAGGTYLRLSARQVGLANPLRPDGKALLEAVAQTDATSLILVPEYLAALVAAMEVTGVRLPLLNIVAVGGASVPIRLLERAEKVGLPVRQGYGMTEAGSVITLEGKDAASKGSVGTAIGTNGLRIASDGEIILDGPLFLGLVGKPREPGPFATGDLGRLDDQGQLWIEGRKSNLIVTSLGRNISPEWIEGLLLAQPEVAQAVVRGDGEATLEALIVPSGPAADIGSAIARVNDGLPDYARVARHRVIPPLSPVSGLLTGNGRPRRALIDQAYPPETEMTHFFDRLVAQTAARPSR